MTMIVQHVSAGGAVSFNGAGTRYVVQTPAGVLYRVYIEQTSLDVVYSKSTDGLVWEAPVTVFTGTATALSIWFDRWSNISAGLIHCAYAESVTDDVLYRSIDTANSDTLGTQTSIFAGASTSSGGALSITRARGGNLYCLYDIDGGTEHGFARSTDAGANWTSRTTTTEAASGDMWIMLPGWAADDNDVMAFFWDASADEISRKLYDNSGDTWGESSIAGTMLDGAASSNFPHFAAAVDITNSQNLLVAWSAIDAAGQDLRCWKVTESAITEVTAVVADGTDDLGFAAIGIDTDTQDWYVWYFGKSDGSETFATLVTLNYKISTDDGATWGSETALTPSAVNFAIGTMICTPRFATNKAVSFGGSSSPSMSMIAADVTLDSGGAPGNANMNGGLQ